MKLPSSLGLAGLGCSLYTMGASATVTSNCVGSDSDVCFQWGVPESVASSGSGNVFFQLQAPNSYSWVGLGIGSQMRGADIFLIYTDGSGNVTLSTRSGTGHVMPEHVDMDGVELLEGSGVEDGQMTANIRCSSCDSLDLSSSNSWIAAWHSGDALDSSDTSESINFHTGETVFSVDFAQASITSDSNPFVGDAADENGANDPGSDNGGVSSGGGGGPNLALIHGIIMLVAFVFMYPLGAILMPVVGRWYVHAGWQTIAFFLMWAGFGIGYVVAKDDGYWWTNTHTKMGTIVVALMGLQPILGGLHHMHYRKHQQRGIVSHVHIWYGRALMLIGIVNGGLGLELAGSPKAFTVAYSVLAGIFGIAYVGAAIFGAFKRTPSLKQVKSPNSMAEAQS